jgi:hypothetical protein
VFPFNCTWSDAIGKHQVAWAHSDGWQGSSIALQCGDYNSLRFHLRLFREGKHTLANTHFEVMIPGVADHEVLSWEFAQQFVVADLLRSGAVEGQPKLTPAITPTPTYRAIRYQVFNGVLPFIAPLLPLLGLPTTSQTADIPIPNDGMASVVRLEGELEPVDSDILVEFDYPYNVLGAPKPFCSTGPLDYIMATGTLHMMHHVQTSAAGRVWARFLATGVVEVTPLNPLTGATGTSFPAVVSELHRSSLGHHRSEVENVILQTLLTAPSPAQSHFEHLWAGQTDRYVLENECGQ